MRVLPRTGIERHQESDRHRRARQLHAAKGTPIEKQNTQCLGCHAGGQRLHWPNSIHQVTLLGCSDCHNPMARFSETGLLVATSITETCYTCHVQQLAEKAA